MKAKFLITKGSLCHCEKSDLLTDKGIFIEDKIFFIKDWHTREFYGLYKISGANNFFGSETDLATVQYYKEQIDFLVNRNLILKLTDHHLDTYFSFKLILKSAFEFDLFYGSTNHLIINTIYYNYYPNGTVSGPFQISEKDDPMSIRRRMEKEELYVISKKQLFEPYSIQKAS